MTQPLIYKAPENKYGITEVICSDGERVPDSDLLEFFASQFFQDIEEQMARDRARELDLRKEGPYILHYVDRNENEN